jgi:hypothetical protein
VEVGLIESNGELPPSDTTTSRRRFMKRAGVAGAIALPTVISISAPAAADHQSGACHPDGTTCSHSGECCNGPRGAEGMCVSGICRI